MKKKNLLPVMLCVCALSLAAAPMVFAEEETESEMTASGEYPDSEVLGYIASDYVKLGDYSNLKIEVTEPEEVTEESVLDMAQSFIEAILGEGVELTDENVEEATYGEYTDVDSFLVYLTDYMESYYAYELELEIQDALIAALAENAEFSEYPIELYREYLTSSVEEAMKKELLIVAVAEQAGLEMSDEEYEGLLAEYAAEYGYESVDDFREDYITLYGSEASLRLNVLVDKVYDYLEDIADVELVPETELETEEPDTEEIETEQ